MRPASGVNAVCASSDCAFCRGAALRFSAARLACARDGCVLENLECDCQVAEESEREKPLSEALRAETTNKVAPYLRRVATAERSRAEREGSEKGLARGPQTPCRRASWLCCSASPASCPVEREAALYSRGLPRKTPPEKCLESLERLDQCARKTASARGLSQSSLSEARTNPTQSCAAPAVCLRLLARGCRKPRLFLQDELCQTTDAPVLQQMAAGSREAAASEGDCAPRHGKAEKHVSRETARSLLSLVRPRRHFLPEQSLKKHLALPSLREKRLRLQGEAFVGAFAGGRNSELRKDASCYTSVFKTCCRDAR